MPKNIVILLDGTSNEIAADRTNILRLYGTLAKSPNQVVWYDPGVGTFGAENPVLRLGRKAREIWGMATGWGLDDNVKEAYRFLVETYDNGKRPGQKSLGRDRIYIFGFSRGAYSARVLAGFLRAMGLIEKRNLNLLDYAYRAYKRIGENVTEADRSFDEVRLYERILAPDYPPIRLLGLFDTVASVIERSRYGWRLRSHAFTKRNTSVEAVRHAVAIDERRTMFGPQLWPAGGEYRSNPHNAASAVPQDLREVWFTGVHGDIGGGYPEAQAALAKLPLAWLIEEARPMGLAFTTRTVNELVLGSNPARHYVAPDPLAAEHDSMTAGWKLLEYLPRYRRRNPADPESGGWFLPRGRARVIPAGALIHRSVLTRAGPGGALPANVPADHRVEG